MTGRTNLASSATTFIGRDADLHALRASLGPGRVVTLVGPPGVGKTRLALQLGGQCADEYGTAGGVWFCDLSDAESASDVCAVVARELDLSLAASRGTDDMARRIGAALSSRGRLLLLVDNFEQVARHAGVTVGAWAATAPDLRIVVTSRERLRIPQEVAVQLDPLPLPKGPGDVAASGAAQLFVERARAVRADFTLDAKNAPTIASLVRRLDGLPLAIELAASRSGVLGPKQLLERIERSLEVLARGAQDRRATLRGTLDWSWNLLEPAEQSCLAGVSVFRGGFSVEAAEGTVALPPGSPPVLDVLQALVDKSLLRTRELRELPGELRFEMLATIRAYASDKLAAAGDVAAIEARHAAWLLQTAGPWVEAVDRRNGPEVRARLSLEYDNIVAIHQRALAATGAGAADNALRAALALEPQLSTRGPTITFLDLLTGALEHPSVASASPTLVARTLAARGKAHRTLGRMNEAIADAERGVETACRARELALQSHLVVDLGVIAWLQGRLDAADASLAEALRLADAAADPAAQARALGTSSLFLKDRGDLARAGEHAEQAHLLHAKLGNVRAATFNAGVRASIHEDTGDLAQALALAQEAAELTRTFGDRRYEGSQLHTIGSALRELGRHAEAREALDRALSCHRELGSRLFEGYTLALLGDLELDGGDPEAACERYRETIAIARSTDDRGSLARWLPPLACARAACSDAEAAAAALEEARDAAAEVGNPFLSRAVEVHFGQLDVLAARVARSEGRAEETAKHLDAARARLAASQDADPRPPAVIRFARSMLERALARFEAAAPASPSLLETARTEPARAPSMLPSTERAAATVAAAPATLRSPATLTTTTAPTERPPADVPTWAISSTGSWFQPPDGERTSLYRRHPLRRMMRALLEHRIDAPGESLSLSKLLASGWPGEKVDKRAGASRVYNALTQLRKLGLGDLIVRREDGYLLDPDVPVARVRDRRATTDRPPAS